MTPTGAGEVDLRSDSGYRRPSRDAEGEVNKQWYFRGRPATAWTHLCWKARRPSCRRALQVSSLAGSLELFSG
eukprot:4452538-Pyramimonas_sp.AAC.1